MLPAFVLVAALAACDRTDPEDGAGDHAGREHGATAGDHPDFKVRELARGLQHPTSLLLLPDGSMLVSERAGRVRRVGRNGFVSAPLAGVPAVSAGGGLSDMAILPLPEVERALFLAYLEPREDGSVGASVARARLESLALAEVQVIHRQEPEPAGAPPAGAHLAFDASGRLFIGQNGHRLAPGSPPTVWAAGTLLRVDASGRAPRSNPFAQHDLEAALWTYGHGDIRGLAFDPRTGKLWIAENGPGDGGEINIAQPGRSYGLEVRRDAGAAGGATDPAAMQDVAQVLPEPPRHAWSESPHLSGLAFYTGRPGAPWNDSVFVGSTDTGMLIRLRLAGDRIVEEERLQVDSGLRIADVRVDADGDIFVLTDAADGRLLQITPPVAE